MRTPETGSRDAIDEGLRGSAEPTQLRGLDLLLRTRAALRLEPLSAPALLFVPIGVVLGPYGLALVTPSLVGHLEPVIAVALATLGVFVGTALDVRSRVTRRLFLAASLESLTTMAVLGCAMMFLLHRWALPPDTGTALVAWMLATAAAASAASVPGESAGPLERVATRVADLDDAGAVMAGACIVAAMASGTPIDAAASVLLTVLVGLLAGVAGWLLFERARSSAERGVFVLGALALLGGGAHYIHCSPLLAGMVAGLAWTLLPGRADGLARADVTRFQHPLVLLLLISAGALINVTSLAVWLLAPFVLFRFTGKMLGAWAAARVLPIPAGDLAAYLMPPGLLGIALAINFLLVSATPTAAAVATAVALGTLISEALALVALPRPTKRMMRRALGLATVLLLMALVQRAGAGEPPLGGIVALALGFALVAAVLVAELTERVGLPRVTGYLLLGLVCGPYVANLITHAMARELGIFNGLAVAVIAFMAGLEMNLQRLRSSLRGLVALTVTTLAIMYGLLLPVLWAAWPWLGIAPDAAGLARLALAIVLTVVVISFSPTVTIAVLTENRARGPLSDVILTTVIFADLVLILSFTVAMQFAAWATGHTTSHDVGIAVHLLWEIPGSLAYGAALGAGFALYLRFVGREVTLVLLGLCVLLSAGGTYLRFEPLLAALAAGLVVENIAPPRGDVLRVAVEEGALPVLVIFFAAAGASLRLDAVAQLGIIAVAISAFRIFSIRAATALGGRMSGLRPDHQRLVWMGLVSQAGVTLGLAVIVANQYPVWGNALQTLVVSMIAIHEVIGPVLLRAALLRAGEIGRMDEPAPSTA